jgi:IAA-amino acid hydrolase
MHVANQSGEAIMPLDTVLDDARSIQDWILDLRRRIHRQPELQYEEVETSRLVQKTLGELDIPFQANIAETGVVATIGGGDGPCVALRADMDALPIHEEADVAFRSEVDGKMHACGHDCHTAMLLGAARLLKQQETELPGTVKLLFQPAEDGGAGGKRMLDEGALENPKVQRIFGLHVWPMAETGSVASRAGTFLAASGGLQIVVRGRGGHAAMPHLSIDPVTTSAKIITELQTIISRELDPLEPGVISITAVHGGEAYNVIPMEMTLRGTIRALTLAQLEIFQNRVHDVATLIAKANLCEAVVEFPGNAYPPTVNDEHCWELAGGIAADLLGSENVLESPPIMGGEDFAYYTETVPGCFVGLGVRNESIGADHNVHHPLFKVDEEALPIGSALHVAFALESLRELSS